MKVLMGTCPACESSKIRPSRLRNPLEKVRQFLTRKKPFRCHACQWRGWAEEAWNPVDRREDLEWPADPRAGTPLTPEDMDWLDKHKPSDRRR